MALCLPLDPTPPRPHPILLCMECPRVGSWTCFVYIVLPASVGCNFLSWVRLLFNFLSDSLLHLSWVRCMPVCEITPTLSEIKTQLKVFPFRQAFSQIQTDHTCEHRLCARLRVHMCVNGVHTTHWGFVLQKHLRCIRNIHYYYYYYNSEPDSGTAQEKCEGWLHTDQGPCLQLCGQGFPNTQAQSGTQYSLGQISENQTPWGILR